MEETFVITLVLSLLQQIKLFHWSTSSYAKHQALDKLHDSLSRKTDLLVETFLARNTKRQPLKSFVVQTSSHSDTTKIEKYLETERDKIQALCEKLSKQPEIQNIMQDIMGDIDQTLYLCRFS